MKWTFGKENKAVTLDEVSPEVCRAIINIGGFSDKAFDRLFRKHLGVAKSLGIDVVALLSSIAADEYLYKVGRKPALYAGFCLALARYAVEKKHPIAGDVFFPEVQRVVVFHRLVSESKEGSDWLLKCQPVMREVWTYLRSRAGRFGLYLEGEIQHVEDADLSESQYFTDDDAEKIGSLFQPESVSDGADQDFPFQDSFGSDESVLSTFRQSEEPAAGADSVEPEQGSVIDVNKFFN